MAWFCTLASKMTGKEIPGVGMAPGGKIKKPKEEVEEHLQHFLAIADAMAKNKNWSFLAQYSILKEMLADLHAIAGDGPDRKEVGGHHHHVGGGPDRKFVYDWH